MTKREQWEAIQQDQLNANKGTPRGMELLAEAIQQLGWGGAITLDAEYNIIGGNKSAEEAAAAGFHLRIVDVGPNEAVAIRRKDLHLYAEDDPRARDLATALNQVAKVNLDFSATFLAAAEERQGATGRDWLFFPEELEHLAAKEAKAEAKEADTADAEQTPLDVGPGKARRKRCVVVVTCPDESAVAELADFCASRDWGWRNA